MSANNVFSRPGFARMRQAFYAVAHHRRVRGLAHPLHVLWQAATRWKVQLARDLRQLQRAQEWRARLRTWMSDTRVGTVVLVMGTTFLTLLLLAASRVMSPLPNPGTLYLPLVAMLAYHWGWRLALIGAVLELVCVYAFFMPPVAVLKPLTPSQVAQLAVLAFGTGFVLALVQLARSRRARAERETSRLAALNRIGASLVGELDEPRLLRSIAQTACDLTGAEFAAFTVRPVDAFGQPIVPSEGQFFRLAAVVGVTNEQESQLRRMALGGEGLLAPIFRHGLPVRIADALAAAPATPQDGASAAARGKGPAREAARAVASNYAHGLVSSDELRYVGIPHGHPIVRSFLGAPLLDTDGQVRGGLLLGHSHTDHFTEDDEALLVGLAAEAAVALENTRLYRGAQARTRELDATFESIADAIAVINVSGEVLNSNRAAHHLLADLEQTHGPAATQGLLRSVATPLHAGHELERMAFSLPGADGDSQEFVISASPLQIPQPPEHAAAALDPHTQADGQSSPSAVVVFHDVTATHRLLAESNARAEAESRLALLRLVVEELPSGAYLVRGSDARLVMANRAATEVWGATWTLGQAMSAFLASSGTRIFGADGQQLAEEDLATVRAVRAGTAIRHHQETIRQPDGTTLPILLNAVALGPGALDILSVGSVDDETLKSSPEPAALVVLQDVTALKEVERVKDDFIGIAAHELRTPMAALKGFAEMLSMQTARGNGPALAEWQHEAIEAIDQATVRLIELTDDLLDVTRLQAGRLELRLEPCDLVALAQRVKKRFGVTSEGHPISVLAAVEHVVVSADTQRIEQVLGNLLNNAIKYSPAGGQVIIRLTGELAAGLAHLSVSDRGIGIPLEQQGRIFGRFVRANNARATGISGTGLGLYLCRELIERHHGRIWFESAPGAGSTFHVTLPLLPADPSPGQVPS